MKIIEILKHLKGEWFCRFYHKPLFFRFSGYGGNDVFGRRRKSCYEFECLKCGIKWESERHPKWYKLPQEERYIISQKIKDTEFK